MRFSSYLGPWKVSLYFQDNVNPGFSRDFQHWKTQNIFLPILDVHCQGLKQKFWFHCLDREDDGGKQHKECVLSVLGASSHQPQLQKMLKSLCKGVENTARAAGMGHSPKFQQKKKENYRSLRLKWTNKQVTWSPFPWISFKAFKMKHLKFSIHGFFPLSEHWFKSRELVHSRVLGAGNRINSQPGAKGGL